VIMLAHTPACQTQKERLRR